MKLKYINYSVYPLFIIPILIFVSCYSHFPSYILILLIMFSLLISLSLYIVYLYRVSVTKRFKLQGTKVQGYIIDGYTFRWGKYVDSSLTFWCEGKLYRISKLSNNKAYKFICNDLKKVGQYGEGVFKIKKYPIDIYFYNDKYIADIKSVNFD